MNFKTTIVLLVLLVGAGIAVFFTNQSSNKDQTQQATETPKKLLDFDTSNVDQLKIAPADGKEIVLKRDGLNWRLLEPIDAPADMNTPSEIVTALSSMASTGRVAATGADASATGLSPPQFKVEILGKDGKSTKLDIGSRSGTGDQLYVHVDGDAQDDLVQADVYDLLDKSVNDFRRKKLLDVNSAQVQHVEVDRPEGKLVLQKVGTNWVIQQPSIMPADTTAVTDLITALAGLQANDFVTETDPNPARYGLDSPAISISFSNAPLTTQSATQATTSEGETTVKFGMLDVRKQYAYVSTSDATSVARVSAGSMDAFKKSALDLRDKQVVNIDPTTVSSLRIQTSLAATTRPTTRPASETLVTIDRRPATPMTAPTTTPATMASTKPVKHSVWEVSSVNRPADAADAKVEALLSALHPLRVTQYDATPTTVPSTADRYTLSVQCPPPLISDFKIDITDPGDSRPLIGRYNGLAFELDRALLDKIKADFYTPMNPQPPQRPLHLGHKSILSDDQIDRPQAILDTFANPRVGRDYRVKFIFPEFTSMCPVTGQPDFATITVDYVPDKLCVEMKSLKLYFLAYRNKGIFYEGVVNTILDDLVAKLDPREMTVTGDFAVRGGTAGVVTVKYPQQDIRS